jgi:hypothetical protein
MNAKLVDSIVISEFQFEIEIENIKYSAKVWLNSKGKFIDDLISFPNGDMLGAEGSEGEIRENILTYLDKNWDTLTK